MAGESPISSLALLKENRVGLESDVPSSVIEFQIPSSTITFNRASRPTRRLLKKPPTYRTQEEFLNGSIASASSLYFSSPDRYPRSFLWRILQDNKVLEIRSVDLSKSKEEEHEALYILRFHFPCSIRQGGIALADAEEQGVLGVFALSTSNELYTLDLKSSFFCQSAASEEDIRHWCKTFKPASTNFSTPHRFVAASSSELLVGLSDGRLLQLTRPRGSDGASWHELACNDGKWGSSLRSLVRWQGSNAVRYGDATLDQDTVQSMSYSPDKTHLWMLCLNHNLKVRNMKQSRTVFTTDLLGVRREPHEVSKLLLDPSNPNTLQLFELPGCIEGDQYYLMTFSPHDLGQFKFWAVRDADAGAKGVRDLHPDDAFLPPDPDPNPESKAIWKVADFKVNVVDEQRVSSLQIWILMSSNRRSKLYQLKLTPTDFKNSMKAAWNHDWIVATSEIATHEVQPQITDAEPQGVIDAWLDFLLLPGRFSQTAIKTALSIYATARALDATVDAQSSLKDNIHSMVSSRVALQRLDSDGMDFEAYNASLGAEFSVLWQDIRDLDALRWDNGSLAYDSQRRMPWLVFADGCSPIRECSQTEIIAHNTQDVLKTAYKNPGMRLKSQDHEDEDDSILPDELAVVVAAAANFRRSFSPELLQICNATLAAELWQDPTHSASLRIELFYDNCGFGSEIEDSAFTRLVAQLDPIGGYDGLENTHFKAITSDILRTMSEQASNLESTRFGLKALVRGIQDIVTLSRQILYDLLILIIVVDSEADREETSMEEFNTTELFVDILDKLRQVEVVRWLAVHMRPHPIKPSNETTVETPATISQGRLSTILEQLFALDVSPRPCTASSETAALTETMQDIMAWIMGGPYEIKLDDVLVRIQCNLLAHNDIDLAYDFLCYQPSTPWSTYIKGRFCLIRGEFAEAALHFDKASFGVSHPGDHTDPATSESLLTAIEVAHLGQGLPAYFAHIQDLYRRADCFSYVAVFAHKILQQTLDPVRQITPLTALFHASVSISDFDSAFSVLTRLPIDDASALLPAFLTKLLSEDEFSRALDLPWPPRLLPHIEGFLAQKATKTSTVAFQGVSAPQYNKLLAAWRMRYLDYRGAAAALLVHLQRVQKLSRRSVIRGESDEIITTYLSVINLLACCGDEDEAWLLTDAFDGAQTKTHGARKDEKKDAVKKKRHLVTIKDVRAEYQKELDRSSMLENGRWGFGLDGADDEDGEDPMNIDDVEAES